MKNLDLSSKFLSLLDPSATSFTFQTVGQGREKNNPKLIQVMHGSLPDLFVDLSGLNQQGAGIFVTVNETDGIGRKAENIKRVRAIWQDDDDGYGGVLPLPPSLVISTSPGRFQRLWFAEGLSKEEFAGLMRTMVVEYGSDPRAADISRVLRLPGFYHTKCEPYLVTIVEASGTRYGRNELLNAFPLPKKPPPKEPPSKKPTFSSSPASNRLTAGETTRIKLALKQIDPDPYDTWLKVGMILHTAYDGDEEGLNLWMEWASGSAKFVEKEHRYKWGTFGKSGGRKLGLGTLFQLADEALYGT